MFHFVLFSKGSRGVPDSKQYAYIPNHAENSWKGWLLNQQVVLFLEAFRKIQHYS